MARLFGKKKKKKSKAPVKARAPRRVDWLDNHGGALETSLREPVSDPLVRGGRQRSASSDSSTQFDQLDFGLGGDSSSTSSGESVRLGGSGRRSSASSSVYDQLDFGLGGDSSSESSGESVRLGGSGRLSSASSSVYDELNFGLGGDSSSESSGESVQLGRRSSASSSVYDQLDFGLGGDSSSESSGESVQLGRRSSASSSVYDQLDFGLGGDSSSESSGESVQLGRRSSASSSVYDQLDFGLGALSLEDLQPTSASEDIDSGPSDVELRRAPRGLTPQQLDMRPHDQDWSGHHQQAVRDGHTFGQGRTISAMTTDGAEWDTTGAMPAKHMPRRYEGEHTWAPYRGETIQQVDQNYSAWGDRPHERMFNRARVNYLDEQEQAQHALRFENGRAHNASGALHTEGASGVGTQHGEGADKHIYVMTGDGELRTADAWGEHKEEPNAGVHLPGRQGHTLATMNHSSLVAGGAVAGAGEIRAEHGEIQQINDSTGHYHSDNRMTRNVVRSLGDNGVDTDRLTTRLIVPGERPVMTSANEFTQAYDDVEAQHGLAPQALLQAHDPRNDVARQLRQKKDQQGADIYRAYRERKERLRSGVARFGGEDVNLEAGPACDGPVRGDPEPGGDGRAQEEAASAQEEVGWIGPGRAECAGTG